MVSNDEASETSDVIILPLVVAIIEIGPISSFKVQMGHSTILCMVKLTSNLKML